RDRTRALRAGPHRDPRYVQSLRQGGHRRLPPGHAGARPLPRPAPRARRARYGAPRRGPRGGRARRQARAQEDALAAAEEPVEPERARGAEAVAAAARQHPPYRAYLLKESLLAVLDRKQVNVARRKLDEWVAWARRSRLAPLVKL